MRRSGARGCGYLEELDILRQKTSDIPYDWDDDNWDNVAVANEPFTLYHFTFPRISTHGTFVCPASRGLWLATSPTWTSPRIPLSIEILLEEETYFPQDQQWILRNLTMKQFVKPELIYGPSISVLGFSEVVISAHLRLE